MANDVVLSDYPEGFQKALSMLDHIDEDKRVAYLKGFLYLLMGN